MLLETIMAQVCHENVCSKSAEALSKQSGIEQAEIREREALIAKLNTTAQVVVSNGYLIYRFVNKKDVTFKLPLTEISGNKTLIFNQQGVKLEWKVGF